MLENIYAPSSLLEFLVQIQVEQRPIHSSLSAYLRTPDSLTRPGRFRIVASVKTTPHPKFQPAYALLRARFWHFEAQFWLAMCVTHPRPPERLLAAYARLHAKACCLLEYRLDYLRGSCGTTWREIEGILGRKA